MAADEIRNPIKGVSGPGKYAKRLDRIPANQYGDQKDIAEIASGAPIARTPDTRPTPASRIQEATQGTAATPVTPLFAPTQRPEEPITAGIDMGAGPGSNALMMKKTSQKLSDALVKMLPYDTTGEIAVLYQEALARGN